MSIDEALRALEKKYKTRLANWTRLYEQDQQNDADGRWNRAHMLQCQDALDDIRALLTTRQEVAPVAWLKELDGSAVKCVPRDFPGAFPVYRDPPAKPLGTDTGVNRNRPAMEPGGVECMKCGCIFIGAECHSVCGVCLADTTTGQTSDARDCPAQFFASGPQGDFFTSDPKFANHLILVAGYDRDDWTVTDLYAAMLEAGKP